MLKDLVIQITKDLPDDVSIEEIFDAIMVRLSIQKGLKDFEENNVTTHEDLQKEIETW